MASWDPPSLFGLWWTSPVTGWTELRWRGRQLASPVSGRLDCVGAADSWLLGIHRRPSDFGGQARLPVGLDCVGEAGNWLLGTLVFLLGEQAFCLQQLLGPWSLHSLSFAHFSPCVTARWNGHTTGRRVALRYAVLKDRLGPCGDGLARPRGPGMAKGLSVCRRIGDAGQALTLPL